jgi:hypothetical protein
MAMAMMPKSDTDCISALEAELAGLPRRLALLVVYPT